MRRWTQQEEERLIAIYETTTYEDILKAFPDRTPMSIRKKAHKLGLKANKNLRHQHLSPWNEALLTAVIEDYSAGVPVHEIAAKTGMSAWAIYRKMKAMQVDRERRTYKVVDTFFDTWNEQSSYWMGFIAADGYLNECSRSIIVSLAKRDREHLEKLNNIIQPGRPLTESMARNMVTCTIRSDRIYQRLLEVGITPRKSQCLRFPSDIPEEQIHHFLRGYFDGDGSVWKRSSDGRIGFKLVGTEDFLSAAVRHLPGNMRPAKKTGENLWCIQTTGAAAIRVLEYLYKDATIYLERKRLV